MVLTAENFMKICRLCLSEKSDLIKFYHQTDVIKRLGECTTVKVQRNDNLPKLICTLCLCQLNTSYTFKKLCESSDAELQRFLSEKQERLLARRNEEIPVHSRENLNDCSLSETSNESAGSEHFLKEEKEDEEDEEEAYSASEDAAHEQSKPLESKRRREKMCCLYCKKYVDSLPKHLVTFHQEEDDVIEFQKYPSRSRKRLSIIGLLRRQGNYHARLEEKRVSSQSQEKETHPVEYFPCTNCLGYYSKAVLINHIRNCQKKKMNESRMVRSKGNVVTNKLSASKILATSILPLIRSDMVLKQIKSDPLILMYGSELCIRNDIKLKSVKIRIRKLIRQIARLLLTMKKANSDITQLIDIFDVKYVDIVMTALDDIAEYNSDTNTYTKYNLAAGLGAGIRKCANIVIANAVIRDNDILKSGVTNYLKLFDAKFGKKFKNTSRKMKRKSDGELVGPQDSMSANENKSAAEVENHAAISGDHDLLQPKDEQTVVHMTVETYDDDFKPKVLDDSDMESLSSLPTTLSENEAEENVDSDKEKVVKMKRKTDDDVTSSARKRHIRRSWSALEQLAVRKYFSDMMEIGTLPTKLQVISCISEEPCLQGRTWQQVKAWINNQHRMVKKDLLNKCNMDFE